MKPTIQVGTTASLSFCVTSEMQPNFGGKTIHPVCSTWDMAHQFELAARQTLEPHLNEDEQGIGTFLSIDHCAPASLGKTVFVEAIITELDESTVVCAISAKIDSLVCATGKQVQRVLPTSILTSLIDEAASR
jgi:predicted thioesterase